MFVEVEGVEVESRSFANVTIPTNMLLNCSTHDDGVRN